MKTTICDMKQCFSMMLLILMVFCSQSAAADDSPRVKTDKDVYAAGEPIQVNFFNAPGESRDWICIVPAGSPETEAGDYDYMPQGKSQGTLTLQGLSPGNYEARAYYNYSRNGYVISARYPFSVASVTTPVSPVQPVPVVEKLKPEDKPALKALPVRVNVSVFHFTPVTMDAARYGIIVTDTLNNSYKMQSSFVLLGKRDLEIYLATNNLQQNEQIDNIVEIGSGLGLNYVIAGSIAKRGTMIVTNCKVISIDQRNIIFQKQFVSTGEADLISRVQEVSGEIIESILRSTN